MSEYTLKLTATYDETKEWWTVTDHYGQTTQAGDLPTAACAMLTNVPDNRLVAFVVKPRVLEHMLMRVR